jgi:siroheme synthase
MAANNSTRLSRRAGRTFSEGNRRGSLVVVGTGIKLVAHTTLEALACIESAEYLFYLVDEPATELWLKRLNPTATSLEEHYAVGKPRDKTYREITARLVSAVRAGKHVCAAFYGHPGVFVESSHAAVRRLRREGLSARMLPGVSTEACLFADLQLDPGARGCQSFEATDFLACRRRFDPSSPLLLWQVGALGEPSIRPNMSCRPERLRRLTAFLRRHYSAQHPVVLYEASTFPVCQPVVRRTTLSRLPRATILPLVTIYLPPVPEREPDPSVMRWFDED